jgi:Virulence factor membrane-bound polymerase, C-terminal/O-Antigen ligase
MLLWLAGTALSALALRERADRRRGWGLLIVCIALFFVAQTFWKLTDSGAAATVTVLRGDSLGRIELLRDSWALITRHPLGGVGYGNFMSARWTELSTSLFEPAAHHTHNAIAQIAVELGLIGALAVLVPLGWALWRCAIAVTRRGVAPEQFLAAAVALLLAGYSLVEYPLWYTYFLMPFALMLGLVEQADLRPRVTPLSRVLRGAGFALAVGACAVIAIDYQRSETLYSSLELQQRESRSGGVRIPMQEAAQISVLSAFDLYANLMYSRALAPDGMLTRYKLDFTERAMLSMTNNETVARQVALLVVAGDLDIARTLMVRTQRNPDLARDTDQMLRRLAPLHPAIAAFVKTLPAPLPPAQQGQ